MDAVKHTIREYESLGLQLESVLLSAPGPDNKVEIYSRPSPQDDAVGSIFLYFDHHDPNQSVTFCGPDPTEEGAPADAEAIFKSNIEKLKDAIEEIPHYFHGIEDNAYGYDNVTNYYHLVHEQEIPFQVVPELVDGKVHALFTVDITKDYLHELLVGIALEGPETSDSNDGQDNSPNNGQGNGVNGAAEGRDSHAENGVGGEID